MKSSNQPHEQVLAVFPNARPRITEPSSSSWWLQDKSESSYAILISFNQQRKKPWYLVTAKKGSSQALSHWYHTLEEVRVHVVLFLLTGDTGE